MTESLPGGPARQRPAFSIPSILAIIAAVVSFKAGAVFGVILAIAAIVLGLIGFLLALSPSVRGGIVSLISIVCGVVGIIAAIVKLLSGNF
jgi:hypothetical protein